MGTETRGLASQTPERRREIAAKGGKASHLSETPPPLWNRQTAAEAGRKSGAVRRGGARPSKVYEDGKVPEGEQLV
jgi:general stress protein YciG